MLFTVMCEYSSVLMTGKSASRDQQVLELTEPVFSRLTDLKAYRSPGTSHLTYLLTYLYSMYTQSQLQIVTGVDRVTIGNCFPEVWEILPAGRGQKCNVNYSVQYRVKAYNH